MKAGRCVAEMHPDHAVVDLAPIAIVQPPHPDRFFAAFGDARSINAADRFAMRMLAGDDLLATVAKRFFIPLDRFEYRPFLPWET